MGYGNCYMIPSAEGKKGPGKQNAAFRERFDPTKISFKIIRKEYKIKCAQRRLFRLAPHCQEHNLALDNEGFFLSSDPFASINKIHRKAFF